jgi:Zn-dependent peptidase ImmA (M78 family)
MTAHAFSDRKVPYRSARQIKGIVQELLARCGMQGVLSIDIVRLIEGYLKPDLEGGLKIAFYDQAKGQPPAYVSYDPLTLNVDREIWSDAKQGEPVARNILAHEIGHIVMHKHNDLGYSLGKDAQLKAPPEEERAEWQANVFGYFLMVTDNALVEEMPLLHKAADIGAPIWVVASVQKYDAARDIFTFVDAPEYGGDPCGDCGNFTLSRRGIALNCETCGWTVGA